MSKLKLQMAKKLIDEGDRDSALVLLKTMPDNETAREWLAKLGVGQNRTLPRWLVILGGIVGIMIIGGLGFFIGRESLKNEIANTLSAAFSGLSVSDPTLEPNTVGTLNNPVPVGDILSNETEAIRVLEVERPSGFKFLSFGSEARPADGAEFVSVKVEYQCATSEVTCYSGVFNLSLVLADGRVVPSSDLFSPDNPLQDDKIIGGANLEVWRFFEIPQASEIKAVEFRGFSGPTIYGLLPKNE